MAGRLSREAAAVALSPLVAYFRVEDPGHGVPSVCRIPACTRSIIVDTASRCSLAATRLPWIRQHDCAKAPRWDPRCRYGSLTSRSVRSGFFATRYLFALYRHRARLCAACGGCMASPPAPSLSLLCSARPVMITAWERTTRTRRWSPICSRSGCLSSRCPAGTVGARCVLVLSGLLLTMAVWSHGMGIVLACTIDRRVRGCAASASPATPLSEMGQFWRGSASCHAGLMVASGLIFGQFNFIRPTFTAAAYLNHRQRYCFSLQPIGAGLPTSRPVGSSSVIVNVRQSHSPRRLREVPTPQLFVGLACTAQVRRLRPTCSSAYHVESLEMLLLVGPLWGVICLALRPWNPRELCRSLSSRRLLLGCLSYGCLLPSLSRTRLTRMLPAFAWLPPGAVWPRSRWCSPEHCGH